MKFSYRSFVPRKVNRFVRLSSAAAVILSAGLMNQVKAAEVTWATTSGTWTTASNWGGGSSGEQ